MSDNRLRATKPPQQEDALDGTPSRIRLLGALVLVLGALAFLTFFVEFIADVIFVKRYLPSRVWLELVEPFATIAGAAVALAGTSFLLLGFLIEKRRPEKHINSIFAIPLLIVMVFVFYFSTANLFRRGLPAMIAVAWGDTVEHPFVIGDVDDRGGRNCHRPIELRDMPVTTTLCEMPQEFRDQLHSGMAVVLIGKGTWMGLFVEDFRKP